jgi:caffeoyl-CoA O-methyltransferase
MDFVAREIEHYAEQHTSAPPEHLLALAVETELALDFPQMMVGAIEGRFLEMLVFSLGARSVLEIGTFSGYSSLSMAAGLPPGGRITTCDINEKSVAIARRFIEKSSYADRIDIRVGPALDTIADLDGPFDFVFIDADKTNYLNYYEAVLPKLAPRGVIAADNTLWSGRVTDPSDTSPDTEAIRAFNDHVRDDPRTVQVQLTVRDGVTLIRKV